MQVITVNSPISILDSYIKNYIYNILKVSKKYEQYVVSKEIEMDVMYELMAPSGNQQKTLETIKTINRAQVINSSYLLNNINNLSLFFSSVPQKVKIYENVNFANTIINIKDIHEIELRDKQTKKIVGEIQLKTSQKLYNDTKQLNNFLIKKVMPNYTNLKQKQLTILLSLIARNAILPVIKRLTPLINKIKKKLTKESFTYDNLLIILENELTNQDNNKDSKQNDNTNIDNQQQTNNKDNIQDQNIEKTNLFKVIESLIRLILKVPFFIVKGLVYFVLALIKLDESYIDKFVDYVSLAIRKATIPFLVLLNRASLNELMVEARKNDLLTPTEFKNKVNEVKQQANQTNNNKQNQQDNQDSDKDKKLSDANKNDIQDQENKEKNDIDDKQNKDNQQTDIQALLENIDRSINTLQLNVQNTRNHIETFLQENNLDKVKEILHNSINGKKRVLADITRKAKQFINQESFNIYLNFENLNIEDYLFYGKKLVIFENINKEQTIDSIIKRVLDIFIEDYKNIKEIADNYDITELKSDFNNYLKQLHNLIINFIKDITDNNQEKYNYYKSYIEDKIANLNIQNQKTNKTVDDNVKDKKDNKTNNTETPKENNDNINRQKNKDVNTELILKALVPLNNYAITVNPSNTIAKIRDILLNHQRNPNTEINSDNLIQDIENSLLLRRTEAKKTGKELQKEFRFIYNYSSMKNDDTYNILKNKSFVEHAIIKMFFMEIYGLAILAKIDKAKSKTYENLMKRLYGIIELIASEAFDFAVNFLEVINHLTRLYKKYTKIDNIDEHINKYIAKARNFLV